VGGGGLILVPALFATFPQAHPATLFGTNKGASVWAPALPLAVQPARRDALGRALTCGRSRFCGVLCRRLAGHRGVAGLFAQAAARCFAGGADLHRAQEGTGAHPHAAFFGRKEAWLAAAIGA